MALPYLFSPRTSTKLSISNNTIVFPCLYVQIVRRLSFSQQNYQFCMFFITKFAIM